MYRVHDLPDSAKLEVLREFLRSRGIAMPRSGAMRPDAFNRFLALLENPRDVGIASLMILRAQAQAVYSPRNIGHYGLGLKRYAPLHLADPPLRRPAGALRPDRRLRPLGRAAPAAPNRKRCSNWVRISRGQSGAHRLPSAMPGIATAPPIWPIVWARSSPGGSRGVTRFGVFVSLDETGAEGLVPGRSLGASRPRFDARRHSLAVRWPRAAPWRSGGP